MRYDIEHRQSRLELRVMELEDTVATLSRIVRAAHEMLADTLSPAHEYAIRLGGLLLSVPSTSPVRKMWPTVASPGGGCCGGCANTGRSPDTDTDTR